MKLDSSVIKYLIYLAIKLDTWQYYHLNSS